MASGNTGVIWKPQSTYLIIEEIAAKPVQVIGIPLTPVSLDHDQLVRRVYQLANEETVHFLGEPLGKQPGLKEWCVEWLLEGEQITSVETGKKNWLVTYFGYYNIITLPGGKTRLSLGGRPGVGSDPLTKVQLYENNKASFSSVGLGNPTAIAFYEKSSSSLKIVNPNNKRAILDEMNRLVGT